MNAEHWIKFDENFCYVYGVYLGDGFVSYNNDPSTRNIIGLKTIDFDFVRTFKKAVLGLTEKTRRAKIKKVPSTNAKKGWIYSYRVVSAELCETLESAEKFTILDAPPKNRRTFLRGMFDSEGSVCGKYTLAVCNTDYILMKIIERLLKMDYIECSFRERKIGGFLPKDKSKPYYEIRIHSLKNIRRFQEKIGFSIARKQKALQYSLNRTKKSWNFSSHNKSDYCGCGNKKSIRAKTCWNCWSKGKGILVEKFYSVDKSDSDGE